MWNQRNIDFCVTYMPYSTAALRTVSVTSQDLYPHTVQHKETNARFQASAAV